MDVDNMSHPAKSIRGRMTRFIATRGFIAPRAKLAIERLRPIVAVAGSLVAFGGILPRFAVRAGFWGIPESDHSWTLLIDSTSLADAEPYGDFLTHPRGHYEVWSHWQRRRAAPLAAQSVYQAIACHEYEDFPRGRIVYEIKSGRFIVYADRRLQQERTMELRS